MKIRKIISLLFVAIFSVSVSVSVSASQLQTDNSTEVSITEDASTIEFNGQTYVIEINDDNVDEHAIEEALTAIQYRNRKAKDYFDFSQKVGHNCSGTNQQSAWGAKNYVYDSSGKLIAYFQLGQCKVYGSSCSYSEIYHYYYT